MTGLEAKAVILLADGMADEPLDELAGRTPLEVAQTPGMDLIARTGRCGRFVSLPDGFPTGSEVANMSVLGCDLALEYGGRGPLEAAGRGLSLQPDDVAFRLNLVGLRDGMLVDYSAGHPSDGQAAECIAALNAGFGGEKARFYTGVSYRNLLVLRGNGFSPQVSIEKPDDHQGERIDDFLPRATVPEGAATADFLRRLMIEAPALLRDLPCNRHVPAPINGVWPWSGGRAGAIRSLADRYGVRGAVISAVDVIVGLGRCLGMDAIAVPGATGYIDTNYEGKARAALAALRDHDLVYLHVEAIDEVSHARDLELKIDTIEQFDARIVVPILEGLDAGARVAVLPDHPVPVRLGKHTRTPVPVALRVPGQEPDTVMQFGETAVLAGSLGTLRGDEFINLLLGPPLQRRDTGVKPKGAVRA